MKTRKRGIVLPSLGIVLISLFMIYSPVVEAQYSPLNSVVGFGGVFNPLVFSPGLRSAAGYYPVFDPFAALSYASSPLLNPLYYPVLPALPFTPLPLIPTALSAAPAASTITRTAAQTGTWLGTWTSTYIAYIVLYHTGPMTMNIVVYPLLGSVAGTVVLQGSKYTNVPFTVTGVKVNNLITLEGIPALGLAIDINCLLTSPTTLTGYYTVLEKATLVDEGVFDLSLAAPVI